MMRVAKEYLSSYKPSYWQLDVERVLMFIEHCLGVIPSVPDRVRFEEVVQLPVLPKLYINLEE